MSRQLLFLIAALCPAFAQNGVIPAAIGYSEPPALQATPGQVITLFLYGVPSGTDGRLRSAEAGAGDLPTSLAGISVRVFQSGSPAVPAALFSVRQREQCGLSGSITGDQSCLLTLVKIQFPFEFAGDLVLDDRGVYRYTLIALMSIDVDGRLGRRFPMQPIPDNGHILTTCDATWDTATPPEFCARQVYHSDGSLVTPTAPAHPGETLFLLYYGLGRTDQAVPTGQVAPSGAGITELIPDHPRVTLGIETNFLNALSSSPRLPANPDTANATSVPVVSGFLQPGQVGIYQVNFTIPTVQGSIMDCGGEVRSNSILLATTSQGVEAVALCVEP